MNGAVELYKACAKHGVKPIVGCEIYLVDDHTATGRTERNHLTLLAADDEGYRNLVKLSSAGFLEGLQRGKPTVDLAQVERHAEGVIALTGCLASRFCQRLLDDREQEARAHADDLLRVFGAENVYFEVQKNGLARAGQVQRGDRADRPGARRQPRGHRRRALSRPRGLRAPHGAAVRADQEHDRGAEADVRHQRVLPARQRGDGARVRRVAGGDRQHARDRRALLGRDRARQAADPALPDARRQRRARVPARARAGGPARALRRPAAGRRGRAHGDGARRDRSHGLQRVLPDRVGLRRVRQGQRHRGRAGPRLGGGLDRLLLPGDHRHRPAASTTCCSSAS